MATARKHPIDLTPTPGFCIKSTVVNPVTLPPPATQDRDNVLEPVGLLVVPAGRKVFINICYDKNVPPPPLADEQAIKRAISAQEHDEEDLYYVPVVVSQPREDKDKVPIWLTGSGGFVLVMADDVQSILDTTILRLRPPAGASTS